MIMLLSCSAFLFILLVQSVDALGSTRKLSSMGGSTFVSTAMPFFSWECLQHTVIGDDDHTTGTYNDCIGVDYSIYSTHCVTSSSTSRLRSSLWMGKGDGKKKRKKKPKPAGASSSDTSSSGSTSPSIQPLRVSNDINIPVKRQIRMAQINKEYQRQRNNQSFRQKKAIRTKYRRTWDEDEIEEKKEERRKRGQDPNWEVVLNQTKASPLVIVDGYNIIYQWPRLKKHMSKGDSQRARQLLIDDLENLRSLKGWRLEVVFDGTRKSVVGPLGHGVTGSKAPVSRADKENSVSESKHGVRVVFTGRGVEADSYIESRCADAKSVTDGRVTGSFIVATDDAMIRLAGQNAGALCMSAGRFVDELKAMKKAIGYRVEAAVAKVNGQPMRPEKLRDTYFHNFGRGSVMIVDKQALKEKRKAEKEAEKQRLEQERLKIEDLQVEEDENGIPWWAKVPNQTRPHT